MEHLTLPVLNGRHRLDADVVALSRRFALVADRAQVAEGLNDAQEVDRMVWLSGAESGR